MTAGPPVMSMPYQYFTCRVVYTKQALHTAWCNDMMLLSDCWFLVWSLAATQLTYGGAPCNFLN